MKKIFLILFLFTLSQTSLAQIDRCSYLYGSLSNDLKQLVPDLTWVDVNPIEQNNTCEFLVRFYPCNSSILNQINTNLATAIKQSDHHCALHSHGPFKHTEGYCTLENIIADC